MNSHDSTCRSVQSYYRLVAPFIDLELADRGDEEFWRNVAFEHRGERVLELGAGSGRVTEILAGPAHDLVAIDCSADMLSRAQARLSKIQNVRFLITDMRTLCLRTVFNLIIAANDPFSHLTKDRDRHNALSKIAGHLHRHGRFILDASWVMNKPRTPGKTRAPEVQERSIHSGGQTMTVRTERRHVKANCYVTRYEYQCPPKPPVRAEFLARYWTPHELEERFADVGLTLVSWWGDYTRRRWNERSSTQLVIVAKKK